MRDNKNTLAPLATRNLSAPIAMPTGKRLNRVTSIKGIRGGCFPTGVTISASIESTEELTRYPVRGVMVHKTMKSAKYVTDRDEISGLKPLTSFFIGGSISFGVKCLSVRIKGPIQVEGLRDFKPVTLKARSMGG